MNLQYQNPFEESKLRLSDYKIVDGQDPLKEKGLYKIIWSMSELEISVDGCLFVLKKNQVLFCTPLNILEIPIRSEETYALEFNREFYCIRDNDVEVSCNGLLFYGSSSPVIINLETDEKRLFEEVFKILKEEFTIKDNLQGEMLRSMLKRLIIKSTRFLKKKIVVADLGDDKVDLVRKFNILVEKNFKTHHKVLDYAAFLFKSPKTISNVFSKFQGKTPLEVINYRIILESKRLMMFSDKSVQEIAYELGYEDAGHFSKFFKKHNNCSPADFKKRTSESKNRNNIHF